MMSEKITIYLIELLYGKILSFSRGMNFGITTRFISYNRIQQELHIKSPLAINPGVEENACGCGCGRGGGKEEGGARLGPCDGVHGDKTFEQRGP